ncbi:protein JTB-like [Anneissia japonica]|uniref:protein JTB-like n=1 Tax=Anneissia japonica TaxID=1529436 RepID=UPI00142579DE|nr:protein JTB-like [Anneissia japonica]
MDLNTFNNSILCNIFLVFIFNFIRCNAGVIPSGNLGLDEKSDSKRESMHTDESSLPCWQREDYKVMGVCERCEYYETNVFQYCKVTGYKLLLKCKESNINTYKSCEASGWPIEKHFWAFEGTMIGLGIVSCSVVYFRRQMLDAETRRRVRLQIENSL